MPGFDGLVAIGIVSFDGNRFRRGKAVRRDLESRKLGKWLVDCHIPHHTANDNVAQQGGGGLMLDLNVK